jgi:hypothetical protein
MALSLNQVRYAIIFGTYGTPYDAIPEADRKTQAHGDCMNWLKREGLVEPQDLEPTPRLRVFLDHLRELSLPVETWVMHPISPAKS